MPPTYAHSANSQGQAHSLTEHLYAVAEMAGRFAEPFQGEPAAYYAGLWHDLGKFNPAFQDYLAGNRSHGPDHKAAGALLAREGRQSFLGLLIQGHHGGLPAQREHQAWLDEKNANPATARALAVARQALPDLTPQQPITIPDFARRNPIAAELWLRMLFSALVDADFLDTERHFSPERATAHPPSGDLALLLQRLQSRHKQLVGESAGEVNAVRAEVYAACAAAAAHPPGIFRLTAPTGAGKTLSALAFALRHAAQNGMERVITAVPFISITQQTAKVYRDFLESAAAETAPAVLEHHSMTGESDPDDFDHQAVWSRLAAENWDAPVVVTTTVQLFESLFASTPGATRKLHNLARSVIILDEAQSLPPELLTPILDALQQLTANYGTSLVLATATQPSFAAIKPFADLQATEIVPNYPRHFQILKRVDYQWLTEPPLSWEQIADRMRPHPQALAVLNTKKDALALLDTLGNAEAFHLSTLLCGRHRSQVLQEIKDRLNRGLPCPVVSTQVVEAGVDLDFPVVLRAFGPLDSIIQAAGRCNREGRRRAGQVIIFQPQEGSSLPPGSYRIATDITRAMSRAGNLDLDDPETAAEYFRQLFRNSDTDAKAVQPAREMLDYPEVARRFRMIDDDTVGAVITNYGPAADRQRVRELIHSLRAGSPEARSHLRSLQPWLVHIFRNQAAALARAGLLAEIMPGLYQWMGDYHPVTGIGGIHSLEPDQLIV